MNELNEIDEQESYDKDGQMNEGEELIQCPGGSDANIMNRGVDGIMNRDEQLKYKKILEK